MMKRLFPYLATLALVLVTGTPAWATKYWISTAGVDSNPCAAVSGAADPGVYKKSLDSATRCLASGDTVHAKAGTHVGAGQYINEQATNILPNGTSVAPTIIEGEGIGVTTFQPQAGLGWSIYDAQWIILRLFTLNMVNFPTSLGGMYFGTDISTSADVLIEDVEVKTVHEDCIAFKVVRMTLRRVHFHHCGNTDTGFGVHGFYASTGSHGTLVEYSEFDHDGNAGAGGSSGGQWNVGSLATGVVFRYNNVHDNNSWGNNFNTVGAKIYGNTYKNNRTAGILLWGTGNNGNEIYNNTFDASSYAIDNCSFSTGCTNNKLTNNILLGTSGTFTPNSTGLVQTTNKTTGVITDYTVSASDFTLKAGSTAIDTGTNVGFAYNGSAPDIGAHESIVFASCVVEDGDASTIRVTFTNNLAPPLLPASGITTFTARKAGANDVITSAVRNGTNLVYLTLTNAIANGNAVDISWASGNLTDSRLIGNAANQGYKTVLTNQSCTNNVGAPSTYTFTHGNFAFHYVRGSEAAPVMVPAGTSAENASVPVMAGASIRVRIAILGAVADPPPTAFFLYFSRQGAGDVALADVFGADHVALCGSGPDPDIPTSGAPTVASQLAGSGTYVAGGLIRASGSVPTIDMGNPGKTEMEYCVSWDTSAVVGETYAFHLHRDDGTAVTLGANTPVVTIQSALGGAQ